WRSAAQASGTRESSPTSPVTPRCRSHCGGTTTAYPLAPTSSGRSETRRRCFGSPRSWRRRSHGPLRCRRYMPATSTPRPGSDSTLRVPPEGGSVLRVGWVLSRARGAIQDLVQPQDFGGGDDADVGVAVDHREHVGVSRFHFD